MQNTYFTTTQLDTAAIQQLGLTEDILMENAAAALEHEIDNYFRCHQEHSSGYDVLIVAGGGNNGADGWTLARRIHGKYRTALYQAKEPKTPACLRQADRARKCCIKEENTLLPCTILVDCVIGSGFSRTLDTETATLIQHMNSLAAAFRIACDVPTGIDSRGYIQDTVFKADLTVTMGAPKTALFSDQAKDYTGRITTADLGIPRKLFEQQAKADLVLLEETDMRLPLRVRQNTYKGSYGHCAVFSGTREGASVLASLAALSFGAGLVSLTELLSPLTNVPCELMHSASLPEKLSAITAGPGLGEAAEKAAGLLASLPHIPAVLDADILRSRHITELLRARTAHTVLTPHPGEFLSLLNAHGISCGGTDALQRNRIELLRTFSEQYPHIAVVLKGAYTYISYDGVVYCMCGGSSALAKAGSGDVLAGMTAALLAQGYSAFDAACTAVLAHAAAARRLTQRCSSFALTPLRLIKEVARL